MQTQIRAEQAQDAAAIEAVTIAAFLHAPHTDHTEQFVVRALRAAGQLRLSLVAELGAGDAGAGATGGIVGHVAASPVQLSCGAAHWYGLGPLSVLPAFQKRGIGGQLMTAALAQLRQLGAAGCVLLGDPAYYRRFGFQAEPSLVLPDVPPEYFQALVFSGAVPTATVSYHAAFTARD